MSGRVHAPDVTCVWGRRQLPAQTGAPAAGRPCHHHTLITAGALAVQGAAVKLAAPLLGLCGAACPGACVAPTPNMEHAPGEPQCWERAILSSECVGKSDRSIILYLMGMNEVLDP